MQLFTGISGNLKISGRENIGGGRYEIFCGRLYFLFNNHNTICNFFNKEESPWCRPSVISCIGRVFCLMLTKNNDD